MSVTGPFLLSTNTKIDDREWLTIALQSGNRTLSTWNGQIARNTPNSINLNVELESLDETEQLTVALETNSKHPIDIRIAIDSTAAYTVDAVIYAGCLLVFLNVLIISEVRIHSNTHTYMMHID